MCSNTSAKIPVRLIYQQTGKPADVLRVDRFSPPPPKPGEVCVRLIASPANPADLNTIEGTYGIKPDLPAVPGIEGCGVVCESGSRDYVAGDLVMFLRRASTWSSHTTVPAECLFKLPPNIDPLQGAMLKVNPATAWQLLNGFCFPGRGNFVVQNAGNSAVGRCVIQLARDLGIRSISFIRRAQLFDELVALGADHVFTDDDEGFAAAKAVMGGANAALAFNAVGGESALRLMKLLCEGGTHITYGAMGRKPLTLPNGLLIFRDIRIRGLWVTRWVENADPAEVRAVYENLAGRVAGGKLVQQVDSTYSLEAFPQLLGRLDAPDRAGKVLFTP